LLSSNYCGGGDPIILDRVVHRLKAQRGRGESYSDVIIRPGEGRWWRGIAANKEGHEGHASYSGDRSKYDRPNRKQRKD